MFKFPKHIPILRFFVLNLEFWSFNIVSNFELRVSYLFILSCRNILSLAFFDNITQDAASFCHSLNNGIVH